jgi:hypothetical protein
MTTSITTMAAYRLYVFNTGSIRFVFVLLITTALFLLVQVLGKNNSLGA